jgi:hypothetical protein
MVSVLTLVEILIVARRLVGARPTWLPSPGSCIMRTRSSCAAMSSGVDVRIDGWDIRGRWFGVVVGATPRLGVLRRSEAIPWRVIAALITPA